MGTFFYSLTGTMGGVGRNFSYVGAYYFYLSYEFMFLREAEEARAPVTAISPTAAKLVLSRELCRDLSS